MRLALSLGDNRRIYLRRVFDLCQIGNACTFAAIMDLHSTEPAIKITNLTRKYRRGGGICDISIAVEPGEWVAVFGGSGAGKSTLLKCAVGALAPDDGSVSIAGRAPRRAKSMLGYGPEDPAFTRIATPHLALSRAVSRRTVPSSRRSARIVEMLELCGLYSVRDRPARELSSGEQNALAIAAAIAPRQTVIVLDDLISKVPPPQQHKFWEYFDIQRDRHPFSLLFATTSSEDAERANRVAIIDEGRLLALDTPAELLARCAVDEIVIEPADPAAVQRTLRGVFDVEIAPSGKGIRFSTRDGEAAAAQLLRHPPGSAGAMAVYLKPPTLWDVLQTLRAGNPMAGR